MRVALAALALAACSSGGPRPVVIGSKKFTEGVLLGELALLAARAQGLPASHRRELGGTQILWKALLRGDIDVYAEYTGTLREEIFAGRALPDDAALAAALAERGVVMSRPLGFDDTYAIGMKEEQAERLGIRTLSDLAAHPELRLGFSEEFLNRPDGWPGLRAAYGLSQQDVRGLDHDLAYRGIASGAIDATDLYSTDAEIRTYGLRVLADDRHHFPAYQAVYLMRADLAGRMPEFPAVMSHLEGRIPAGEMIAMNARAKLDKVPEGQVAADWLSSRLGMTVAPPVTERRSARIWARTREHLALVGLSLLAALAAALPLGVLAARRRRVGQAVLAIVGVIQTVPSLALLVMLIPVLGIGVRPALAALFLYSLLPIVRNTHAGLVGIPRDVRESAEALGLPGWARLVRVELPMASRAILAGVKTSAVICIGTATLGALIGAGGYGQPILTGIRLDDVGLILEGAVPAAAMALVAQAAFELAERHLVPRGLRL